MVCAEISVIGKSLLPSIYVLTKTTEILSSLVEGSVPGLGLTDLTIHLGSEAVKVMFPAVED